MFGNFAAKASLLVHTLNLAFHNCLTLPSFYACRPVMAKAFGEVSLPNLAFRVWMCCLFCFWGPQLSVRLCCMRCLGCPSLLVSWTGVLKPKPNK